jgi:hypothetical protein
MNAAQVDKAVRAGSVGGLAIVGSAGIASIRLPDAPGLFEAMPSLGDGTAEVT